MEPAAERSEGRATLQVLEAKLEQLFKLRLGADRKGMAERPTPRSEATWGNCLLINKKLIVLEIVNF